jgi:hypothetical protein
MHFPAKKNLVTGIVLGLAMLCLSAYGAVQFGNLPLWFEAGPENKFIAHAQDAEFSISPTGAEFNLAKSDGTAAGGRVQFIGANPAARITGQQKLSGTVNYLVGNVPSQWKLNVPTFEQVRVENIYHGINATYYGNQQKLEFDFDIAAGADPSIIAFHYTGADKISINLKNELVVSVSNGEMIQRAPVAYQTIDGVRQKIAATYKVLDSQTATIALGNYNRNEPLVIDPVLNYSTYFGGNLGDTGWAIAINTNGDSVFVAGQTFSTQFSNNISFSTPGAFQTSNQGGSLTGDAFVARFENSGTKLIYATYLGGSAGDAAYAIAVDNFTNAFIAGSTRSPNFPVKNSLPGENVIAGKIDPNTGQYPNDAFVAELDASGSNLVYSTYLGGNGYDYAFAIALDAADNAFITGNTYSTNFPFTPNAFQSRLMCSNSVYPTTAYINANAFVTEISSGGTNLNYSTFLGGTNFDVGRAIAFNNDRLFVAGNTESTNFPTTNYINNVTSQMLIQTNFSGTNTFVLTNSFNGKYLNSSTNFGDGNFDAFVAAFSAVGTNVTLLYSTCLGGTNSDFATGIAADTNGNAYVVGTTTSSNFPCAGFGLPSFTQTNNYYYGYLLATNSFLTQVKWDGTNTSIGFSTMFGQLGADLAGGVALDAAGDVFVVGSASSTNFPTTGTNLFGSLTATNASYSGYGYSDVFVTAFAADFSKLLYSTYLGGSGNDFGYGIAVDPAGNAFVVGQTTSVNFPTLNAVQTSLNGTSDMFLAEILRQAPPSLTAVLSGQNVLVSWPPAGQANTNYVGLQTITNLLSTNWVFTPLPALINGTNVYAFPPTNPAQFFRLHKL